MTMMMMIMKLLQVVSASFLEMSSSNPTGKFKLTLCSYRGMICNYMGSLLTVWYILCLL